MPRRKPSGRPTQTNGTLDFNEEVRNGKLEDISDLPINNTITSRILSQLVDDQGQPVEENGLPVQVNYLEFDLESSPLGFNGAKITRLASDPSSQDDVVDQLQIELFVSPGSRKTISVDAGAGRSMDAITAQEVNKLNPDDSGVRISFGTGSIAYRVYGGTSTIEGGEESDFLYGSREKETIDGKGGTDYMNGGGGDDTYIVDHINDYIGNKPGTGIETVTSSVTWDLRKRSTDGIDPSATGMDHLILTGSEAIDGIGNYVSNRIEGNSSNNILNGFESVTTYKNRPDRFGYRETRDIEQQDTLTGGGGADTFALGDESGVFYREKGSKDYVVITDFSAAGINPFELDTIQLKGSIGDYSLRSAQGIAGFSASDTAIFHQGGNEDLIGIVRNWSASLVSTRLSFV